MDRLKGYFALTDPEWHAFLASKSKIDEVNFWQPHGERSFRMLRQGDPFFFKLRAPQRAIAGFGLFARFAALPAWLAWDCFGEMNGAPNFESMLDRIMRLREKNIQSQRAGDFNIGCIIISSPVFFKQKDWIDPPKDWAKTGIQQGKGYFLDHGEGKRIYKECLDKTRFIEPFGNIDSTTSYIKSESPRYGKPITIQPRLGQGLFSLEVREAYNGACAVTNEHSAPVLEAAHIQPYNRGGEHRVDNGLLLRRDLHRLFDLGYVTITSDYKFKVGDSLRDEFKNGHSYYGLNNYPIHIPSQEILKPRKELLDWHGQKIFKG
jgi:putative restriction endonuclease